MAANRHCSFCELVGDYDDLPDGTVCYLGITACAACLNKAKTEDFRSLLGREIEEDDFYVNTSIKLGVKSGRN